MESLDITYVEQYAEYTLPLSRGLSERVRHAVDLYPCDILFVHRDAEREAYDFRLNEINTALQEITIPIRIVPVIPVRMTEAWLLFDEPAIRQAVGNPNGRATLGLPRMRTVETVPDPKLLLFEALKNASELTGKRLSKFQPQQYRHRVAELITNFSPLRELPSFLALEASIIANLHH